MCAPVQGLLRVRALAVIPLKSRGNLTDTAATLKVSDGYVDAALVEYQTGKGPVEWIVVPSKGDYGMPRREWMRLWDDNKVDVEQLLDGRWQDLF